MNNTHPMIYVIDIETTGLDPERHGILEIGAVELWNRKRPLFLKCRPRDSAAIDEEALAVNGYTLQEALEAGRPPEYLAVRSLLEWMRPAGLMAGHNVHFDHGFLAADARRYGLYDPRFSRLPFRLIDLHSIAAGEALRGGLLIGADGLAAKHIFKSLDMPPEPKPHAAIRGAVWTAEALRRLLGAAPDRQFWDESLLNSHRYEYQEPKPEDNTACLN